jgi:hypothetical protein
VNLRFQFTLEGAPLAQSFRSMVVDKHQLRWRFDERVVVIPADRSGPQLYVDWGWQDWLEPEGPRPEPLVVTPRFVAAAIQFALAHGWQPFAGGQPLRLGFQGNAFSVVALAAIGESSPPSISKGI